MAINKALFSSAKDDWETPPDFFERLNAEFGFTIDVCASKDNAKCEAYYTIKDDALKQEWTGICWQNPPYGRGVLKWIQKAYLSAMAGAIVVCLIPSRTDTVYWHSYVMRATEIRFVRGRLKFVGAKYPAPFPSAVIVFDGSAQGLLNRVCGPRASSMNARQYVII